MTREQVLELQKVHTQIYNDTIKPLYEEAKRKEKELKNGKVLKKEDSFNSEKCKDFKVISKTTNQ